LIRVAKHGPHGDEGDTLVVFKEDPMTYVCVFDRHGKMKLPADSIRILGRCAEFERAFQDHIEGLGF